MQLKNTRVRRNPAELNWSCSRARNIDSTLRWLIRQDAGRIHQGGCQPGSILIGARIVDLRDDVYSLTQDGVRDVDRNILRPERNRGSNASCIWLGLSRIGRCPQRLRWRLSRHLARSVGCRHIRRRVRWIRRNLASNAGVQIGRIVVVELIRVCARSAKFGGQSCSHLRRELLQYR